jgi:glycosyltransferase involved in cell wall biosynthesis
MSLGLIARADNTGLGIQSWEFHRHLQPDKTLIVDLTGQSASGKDLTIYPDRFPGATVVSGPPTRRDLKTFLDGLDSVFTMETPYTYELYTMARQRGIQTVLQGNWELLDYLQDGPHHKHLPDVLALPSSWNLVHARRLLADRMSVIHLPVPIATDRWQPPADPPPSCRRFLHVAGHPAIGDRNGTRDLLTALQYVRAEVTITLTCQRIGYLASLITRGQSPDNVTVVIESDPPQNYWDLYTDQHALVLPRRYGGLSLPVNEAIGAGLPVLMPAISPNTRWLPEEWLTPATLSDTIHTKTLIDVYRSYPQELAARIDRLAHDEDFYTRARYQARKLAVTYGWPALLPYYQEILR